MRHVVLGVALLALLIVLVGGMSAFILRGALAHKDEVISMHAGDLLLLEEFIATHERGARKARSFLLTGNERFLEEHLQVRAELEQRLIGLRGRVRTPQARELVERITYLEGELEQEGSMLIQSRKQGLTSEEAGQLLEQDVQPLRDELDSTLAALKHHAQFTLEQAKYESGRMVSQAFTLLAAAVGASVLLSGVLASLLLRSWRRVLDASRFQQRVVAIVGHDVRSPLAAILASASHAIKRQDLDEQMQRLLGRVLRAARRIETLTRMLMDFALARLDSGLRLAPEPGDLHALCERVVAQARTTWVGRELALKHEGNGKGDFDSERLGQALANVVDNALRHGAANSCVRVVSRGTSPSVLVVEVHNDGPPIDRELLPYIFEPFRHGQNPELVVRESMGMGLYLVAEVVRAHGGRVDVDSTLERGTTFTLRLPRLPVSPDRVRS